MPTYLNDKYLLGRELGQGASCKVRLAKDNNKIRYAAKIFKSDVHFSDMLKTELEIMSKLKHPGIINLIEQGSG
jgi:serine/threonine protein kinase